MDEMPQSPIRDDGNFAKNFSFPFTQRVCVCVCQVWGMVGGPSMLLLPQRACPQPPTPTPNPFPMPSPSARQFPKLMLSYSDTNKNTHYNCIRSIQYNSLALLGSMPHIIWYIWYIWYMYLVYCHMLQPMAELC